MTEPTTFDDAVMLVRRARGRAALFGTVDPVRIYRQLVKLVHPDRAPEGRDDDAKEAFTKLQGLWTSVSITVKAPKANYELGDLWGTDELADYLIATAAGSTQLVAKVARRPTDNDLFRREAENLKIVRDATESKHQAYLPLPVDSFAYRDPSGAERQINIFAHEPNFFSLKTILEQFPDGLDARHVAWIWRRMLVAVGLAHHAGIVYGAMVPDHVLIEPNQHGVVLANWCYSAARGQTIPAIVKQWRDDYPSGVLDKQTPSADTDVHMVSRLVLRLLDAACPKPLTVFAQDCFIHAGSAWKLLGKLDDVLSTVYGPRKFTPFPAMPSTVPAWPLSKG